MAVTAASRVRLSAAVNEKMKTALSIAVLCVVPGGRTVPEPVLTLQAQRLAGLVPGAHSQSVAA
jgi:hypothetical protein